MTPAALRILKVLGTGVAATLVLAACGSSTPPGKTLASSQTLKFPILGDFGTLDPGEISIETDSEIAQNMYDGLLKYDSNLNLVPDIATSMPTVSSDQLTYTFKLRQDVTFWNGDKVTSKDVLYSWNRAAWLQGGYAYLLGPIVGYSNVAAASAASNAPTGAALESKLEANDPSVSMSGLTAPDPYTVVMHLSAPATWILSGLALESTSGMLVDMNAVKQDPQGNTASAQWWRTPATAIGTGAFKMTAYTAKTSIDFAAVPNWWGSPKPTLTSVHIDILGNAESAIQAYEQGSYDLYGFGGYSNAPIDAILRIQGTANEKNQLLLHPKVRTTWVQFNLVNDSSRSGGGPFACPTQSAALEDTCSTPAGQQAKDLRLAFALSVDKTQLASVVCHNIVCSPATGGLITKGLIGYAGDNSDPLAKFDPTMAKSLLQQGDPTGSKTANLTYTYDPNNPLNVSAAQFLQEQWQNNLGIHVNLAQVDHSAFINGYLSGKYELARNGWQADYNNPQDWTDGLWGKTLGCPDANCGSGYDTAQWDQLDAQANSSSLSAGVPIYQQMMKMLEDDATYIPLYYSVGAFLIKPYVQGAGTNNFNDYWWDQYQILQH